MRNKKQNQGVHMDIFGPLKTTFSGKSYILCVTDAYAELVAIPNKSAVTVYLSNFFEMALQTWSSSGTCVGQWHRVMQPNQCAATQVTRTQVDNHISLPSTIKCTSRSLQ